MLADIIDFSSGCWLVLGQMAPYLLFGFLITGILSVCISAQWVEKYLGGRDWERRRQRFRRPPPKKTPPTAVKIIAA